MAADVPAITSITLAATTAAERSKLAVVIFIADAGELSYVSTFLHVLYVRLRCDREDMECTASSNINCAHSESMCAFVIYSNQTATCNLFLPP